MNFPLTFVHAAILVFQLVIFKSDCAENPSVLLLLSSDTESIAVDNVAPLLSTTVTAMSSDVSSTAALITGRYPMRYGLQHLTDVQSGADSCELSLDVDIGIDANLVSGLSKIGYQTYYFTEDKFDIVWDQFQNSFDHFETGIASLNEDTVSPILEEHDENPSLIVAQVTQSQTISEMISSLSKREYWSNMLIIAMTMPNCHCCGYWQDGIDSALMISGGFINDKLSAAVIDGSSTLMHITDVYPTLLSAITDEKSSSQLDGMNVWSQQTRDKPILLNVDSTNCDKVCGAMRFGNYKLIIGNNDVVNANINNDCKSSMDSHQLCNDEPCLFDLSTDSCESENIASEYPTITQYLLGELQYYYNNQITPIESLDCSKPKSKSKSLAAAVVANDKASSSAHHSTTRKRKQTREGVIIVMIGLSCIIVVHVILFIILKPLCCGAMDEAKPSAQHKQRYSRVSPNEDHDEYGTPFVGNEVVNNSWDEYFVL